MADRSDDDDPWRLAFWNRRNRESTVPDALRHHGSARPQPRTRSRRVLRLARIAVDIVLVLAWLAVIGLILFYPSEVPDTHFGPYG